MLSDSVRKKRLSWVDNCRGICLIFVIIHHVGFTEMWFVKLYLPYFLTSFFFVSGFLFVKPDRPIDTKQKFLNIISSLLFPYLIYCTITALFNLITGGIGACIQDLQLAFLGVKSWFISALLVIEILACFILSVKKYRGSTCALFMVISAFLYFLLPEGQYAWNFRNALLANIYFCFGVFCRTFDVVSFFFRNIVGIICLFLYMFLFLLNIKFNILQGNFNETFSNYPFFFLSSFVGIPALIYICNKIKKFNSFLLFIGVNSLLFYYLQSFVIRGVLFCMEKLNLHFNKDLDLIMAVVCVCAVISPIVILINRYFPIMSGKYKIKLKSTL